MDIARIRSDFPILRREFHGRPLVYLDSAATSQKPQSVIDAESAYYEQQNANVHRGVYALAEEATELFEKARERVARFLNAPDPSEIVFLRGTTEAINLVAYGLSQGSIEPGDRIVTTVMEHHSNIVPWHFLRSRRRAELEFVDIDEAGRLKMEDYDRLLDRRTKVVALTQVSNVLGTVNPVKEIAERAHDVGALVVVDAAQSAPHRPVDVQALGADFVAFSGHKTLGPTGIGVLWGRSELLTKLPPFLGGGEMIQEVHQDRVLYREPPARFEAGTPNVGGAVALASALDYLTSIGWEEIAAHGRALGQRARRLAAERFGDDLRFVGPPEGPDREPIYSFTFAGVHPHDIASILDASAVAVRAGHHCAQPLMERLGVPALTRASPYVYNNETDVDTWMEGMARVRELFGPAPARTASAALHARDPTEH
jgi:cysteine desulfurase/selenocysteine lyase